jgi:trans-AT polyketide synthase/acyltransferase/oxidoreductase domain-containing protein
MGKELYNQDQTFSLWMNRLDEIVKAIINESVISVLYDEKAKKSDFFDRTLITHPAIFMFEYSLYRFFSERNICPDSVLGASLGEFTSAAISGVLDFEDALKMVVKHAETIQNTCANGGMMAFLHRLDYFNELKQQYPDIELSSINSNNHFVISGHHHTLLEIMQMIKNQDIIAQILPVSHAFHSKLIDPAFDQYHEYLKTCTYKTPSIPFISCVTGSVIDDTGIFENGYFWDVCRKPILIKQAIENLENSSTQVHGPFIYLDMGPAGTLVNLIKQNLAPVSGSQVQSIISPFGKDITAIKKAENFINGL